MTDQNIERGVMQRETCKALREGCLNRVKGAEDKINEVNEVSTKRLDAHATDIKALERVSLELAGTAATLTRLMEAQDGRIKTLEEERIKQLQAEAEAAKAAANKKKAWYETKLGEWVVKVVVIVGVLVLAAAIGRPFLDAAAQIGLPQ